MVASFRETLAPSWMRGRSRFGLVWLSSSLSNLADGIVLVALPLVAIRLSQWPLAVSLVIACNGLPWLLSPLLGALVDRGDRRALAASGNLMRGVALCALAAITATEARLRCSLPVAVANLSAAVGVADGAFRLVTGTATVRRAATTTRSPHTSGVTLSHGEDPALWAVGGLNAPAVATGHLYDRHFGSSSAAAVASGVVAAVAMTEEVTAEIAVAEVLSGRAGRHVLAVADDLLEPGGAPRPNDKSQVVTAGVAARQAPHGSDTSC